MLVLFVEVTKGELRPAELTLHPVATAGGAVFVILNAVSVPLTGMAHCLASCHAKAAWPISRLIALQITVSQRMRKTMLLRICFSMVKFHS